MDKLKIDKKAINMVIYHRDCTDGFGAAWCALKALGTDVMFLSAKHGDPPPSVKGKTVVIFDYAWDLAITQAMIKEAKQLVIIDHHKSAYDGLGKLPAENVFFDMSRSAAILAWQFFFGNKPPPTFLQYIEERDLWVWSRPEAKAFSAYIDQVPMRSDEYEKFADEAYLQKCVRDGELMLQYQNYVVDQACAMAAPRLFRGHRVLVANCTVWMSEVGNAICDLPNCAFSLVWNYNHRDRCNYISLRSNTDEMDVSAIARQFGGGGHQRAAGFRFSGDIEDLFDKEPEKPT